MDTTPEQKHQWYVKNKEVLKKRRQTKTLHTPKGYLCFVWKYYDGKFLNEGRVFPIPRKMWIEYWISNILFQAAFTDWKMTGFKYEEKPCITKTHKEAAYVLQDMVIKPYSQIK